MLVLNNNNNKYNKKSNRQRHVTKRKLFEFEL